MGWLSQAWKGVRKVVKQSARRIKLVTKKVVTSLPGGKALWSAATKVGKKVAGTIGKVVNALGPIGMIALSVLAPYAAPLWAGFGAAASTAAAAGSLWGTVGTAIYNGVNWVGATLGAMSKGIADGIGHIASKGLGGLVKGSLSEGLKTAASGFAQAFSGEAGKAGIQLGIEAATESALQSAAGSSIWKQTQDKIMNDVLGTGTETQLTESAANDAIEANMKPYDPSDPFSTAQASPVANPIETGLADGTLNASPARRALARTTVDATLKSSGGTFGTTVSTTGSSLLSKVSEIGKGLLSQQSMTPLSQAPQVFDVGGNQFSGNTQGSGGAASAGGSLLSQSMLQQMQAQQQRMSRGFN